MIATGPRPPRSEPRARLPRLVPPGVRADLVVLDELVRSVRGSGDDAAGGALDRLERLGLIEPLPADDRRHPYRITAAGAAALRVHLDSLERVSAAGRLRLQLGGI